MQLDELREELDLHWSARDYARVASILDGAHERTIVEPDIETRARISDVIRRYVSPERLNILMLDFVGGALPADVAARFWDLCPDEVVWPLLLDTWTRVPEGETRTTLLGALRQRAAKNADLMQQALASPELRDVLWSR